MRTKPGRPSLSEYHGPIHYHAQDPVRYVHAWTELTEEQAKAVSFIRDREGFGSDAEAIRLIMHTGLKRLMD